MCVALPYVEEVDGTRGEKLSGASPCRCMTFSKPIATRLLVYIIEKQPNYPYKMTDQSMCEQLWPANGTPSLFADVELVVSGVSFKAHRAILAARSAVFTAMFTSEMSASVTGRVEIPDVSPETFGQFLQFVYTGRLHTTCLADRELATCADKYQVNTLSNLCTTNSREQASRVVFLCYCNTFSRLG